MREPDPPPSQCTSLAPKAHKVCPGSSPARTPGPVGRDETGRFAAGGARLARRGRAGAISSDAIRAISSHAIMATSSDAIRAISSDAIRAISSDAIRATSSDAIRAISSDAIIRAISSDAIRLHHQQRHQVHPQLTAHPSQWTSLAPKPISGAPARALNGCAAQSPWCPPGGRAGTPPDAFRTRELAIPAGSADAFSPHPPRLLFGPAARLPPAWHVPAEPARARPPA